MWCEMRNTKEGKMSETARDFVAFMLGIAAMMAIILLAATPMNRDDNAFALDMARAGYHQEGAFSRWVPNK